MVAVLVKKVIEYMDCHKISSDALSYSSIAVNDSTVIKSTCTDMHIE